MSTSMNNLFNFSRPLPAPYNGLSNKKVKVSSMYGDGTEATLNASMIKAVHAVCKCMDGKGEGAVGVIDHRTVAEYKSSAGPDTYHIVVYDSTNGSVLVSIFDRSTELIETYTMLPSKHDGAAVLMAMYPAFAEDIEFKGYFEKYYQEYLLGFPDLNKAKEYMGYLCDNAYRRIKDETCSAHLKVNIDKSGNVMRVSQAQLDSGVFTPKNVIAGEFCIFAKTARTVIKRADNAIDHSDFVGKYTLQNRVLTQAEQKMVPVLPNWYIIPPEIVDICKLASATTGKPTQMRNFLLRGPAGTGKTMGAKAIAAGLGLPYVKYTCSAGTEIFDFKGQVFPCVDQISTGDAQLDAERAWLEEMGGINYANVSKLMQLPDLDDMDYDPAGVYQALTGSIKASATSQECMAIVLDRVTEKVRELSKHAESEKATSQNFTYVETDFMKAMKKGYVVELQEPTTIIQPGVLVGLNSMLEQGGSIRLETGEVIERHPDAVVVVTTNVTYEGCRNLNQSFVDRMSLVRDLELPTREVMVQRAMSVTGETDEYLVSQMVQVVCDMADYCRKNSISDGNVGMRSLLDWIVTAQITGDVYKSALYTIISKATSDEEDRESLITSVLEPIFAPSQSSVAV